MRPENVINGGLTVHPDFGIRTAYTSSIKPDLILVCVPDHFINAKGWEYSEGMSPENLRRPTDQEVSNYFDTTSALNLNTK